MSTIYNIRLLSYLIVNATNRYFTDIINYLSNMQNIVPGCIQLFVLKENIVCADEYCILMNLPCMAI
jgi:hypothetical protein